MKNKKIDPIKLFEIERLGNIKKLGKANGLKRLGREFIEEAAKLRYTYNFSWLGRPIIQIPQDMIVMQEIIWDIKPDLIIETGIAHGGSLIFYASMLEFLGKGEVLGIDIDIRKHNKKEIEKHKMFKRIKMIEGSSVDQQVVAKVLKIAKNHKKILVCLDSLHSHDHVLKELEFYSRFVTRGSYVVVFDTLVEHMKKFFLNENRPWGKGNNPATAVRAFLKKNNNFVVDKEMEDKLVLTFAPGGFLKRIK
ncbi:MAG: cephalosporin hydroxylase family protein [Patescibacteria group bacterium]